MAVGAFPIKLNTSIQYSGRGPMKNTSNKAPVPEYPPLPSYALKYAPILWLHGEEMYWPGDVLEHLGRCSPQNKDGSKIDVPDNLIGKTDMLKLPNVDHQDVFLCLAVSERWTTIHRVFDGPPLLTGMLIVAG